MAMNWFRGKLPAVGAVSLPSGDQAMLKATVLDATTVMAMGSAPWWWDYFERGGHLALVAIAIIIGVLSIWQKIRAIRRDRP